MDNRLNMVSFRLKIILVLPLVAVAVSCTSFEQKRTLNPEGAVPEQYAGVTSTQPSNHRSLWWESFESDELDALMARALDQNLSLTQLWARLQQSQAVSVQARSGLYPQLDLELGAGVTRSNQEVAYESAGAASDLVGSSSRLAGQIITSSGQAALGGGVSRLGSSISNKISKQGKTHRVAVTTEDYSIGLAASYEVDIWGRVRSGAEAATLDLLATRYDLESSAMTLCSQVAEFWFLIREQQMNRAVLDKQLKTNQTYLELVELRFRKSLVTALDVYQQRQKVADVEAKLPLAESEESVLRHGLAILLGDIPTAELNIGEIEKSKIKLPELPVTGLPIQLLENRPDIQSAWASLRAADFRVAVAKADQLPAIRLDGGIGYRSDEWNTLFDSWFMNLAGSLTQPLFDGYQRKAEVERTKAVVEERLAAYRLTVLNALGEVEDALVQERKQREYIDARERQIGFASEALNRARQQYLKGIIDYLPVLTQLTVVQDLELELIQSRRQLFIYRVNLYRALGGVWSQELTPSGLACGDAGPIGDENLVQADDMNQNADESNIK